MQNVFKFWHGNVKNHQNNMFHVFLGMLEIVLSLVY